MTAKSAYLTVPEVAEELGISANGVYKLIQRGKLPVIRKSANKTRVSRLALDAYQRRLSGAQGVVPTHSGAAGIHTLLRDFKKQTGMVPAEWERRWKADEIEDTAETMQLTIRALSLRAAGADGVKTRGTVTRPGRLTTSGAASR
jgi:excisionase family DNA binding protein